MINSQFIFRTDASLQIGTGHVMRCLTLADALKVQGVTTKFICRDHKGHLFDLICERGYEVLKLPRVSSSVKPSTDDISSDPVHASWLGIDWRTDSEQTQTALGRTKVDWLIADHYAIDCQWESELRPACKNLMVIDDLADRIHDCDVLLDQNLGRMVGDYGGLAPAQCELLIGPKYALLRPEFAALREFSLARRTGKRIKQILVFMGGVDLHNATGKVLAALSKSSLPGSCKVTVIVGAKCPWLGSVKQQAIGMPWRTEVLETSSEMAQLMADSDLAIGAVGGTSWERCCLGLPTLFLVIAENQTIAAKSLQKAGAGIYLGALKQVCSELPHELSKILLDGTILTKMIEQSSVICDGFGASRVVERLINRA